jgi:predicted outer membrane repeat protein
MHSLGFIQFIACLFSAAYADQLLVPQEFNSIQSALDIAQNGDSVFVAAGVYNEQIQITGNSVLLASTAGALVTTINAEQEGTTIVINSSQLDESVEIRGFTVRGGFAPLDGDVFGGGLRMIGGSATIRDNIFSDNSAYLGGGAAFLGCSPHLINNQFIANAAHMGGGLYADDADLVLHGNVFTNNQAIESGYGGAISFEQCSAELEHNTFYGNSAFLGGGISWRGLNDIGVATVSSSTFSNNSADFGGAIYLLHTDPLIVRCILAFSDIGGGVFCNMSTPEMECCLLYGNEGDDEICGSDIGGNIFEDPLFCDPFVGNLRIDVDSPCWDGECGIIGSQMLNCEGTSVSHSQLNPKHIDLFSAYPNPFNPTTIVSYELTHAMPITLDLYNINGRLITNLQRGLQTPGFHQIPLDGSSLVSGVYILRIQSSSEQLITKVLLLK